MSHSTVTGDCGDKLLRVINCTGTHNQTDNITKQNIKSSETS